jgi:uncharacterized membrane protein HdeD (DUF308 family)
MEPHEKKLWFKAKLYGWGWTPVSWQGWLIIAAYVAALIFFVARLEERTHSASGFLLGFAPYFIVLTVLLLVVCYKKGEKPGWHWGNVSDKPHP